MESEKPASQENNVDSGDTATKGNQGGAEKVNEEDQGGAER